MIADRAIVGVAFKKILWQTPLEKVPVIEQGSPCRNNRPGGGRDTDGGAQSDSLTSDVNVCGIETTMLFVSKDLRFFLPPMRGQPKHYA